MLCPTCGQPTQYKDNPARPFCSERCKLIDFGHWADEDYRVPIDTVDPSFDEEIEESSEQSLNEGESV